MASTTASSTPRADSPHRVGLSPWKPAVPPAAWPVPPDGDKVSGSGRSSEACFLRPAGAPPSDRLVHWRCCWRLFSSFSLRKFISGAGSRGSRRGFGLVGAGGDPRLPALIRLRPGGSNLLRNHMWAGDLVHRRDIHHVPFPRLGGCGAVALPPKSQFCFPASRFFGSAGMMGPGQP